MSEENYRAEEFVEDEDLSNEEFETQEDDVVVVDRVEETPIGTETTTGEEFEQEEERQDTTPGQEILDEPKRFRVISYDDFVIRGED